MKAHHLKAKNIIEFGLNFNTGREKQPYVTISTKQYKLSVLVLMRIVNLGDDMNIKKFISKPLKVLAPFVAASVMATNPVMADETCMSPYMVKIVGQEDFVYVWTLGVEGLGDGQDKMVTVDVNPKSDNYGKVIASESVGGRNEAHHSGFTDDRKYLWAGGLD